MAVETTYTSLRENLAQTLDRVVNDQEVVIVRRKSAPDVALVPATELSSLLETAHLLRSPRNARRLIAALRRAKGGSGARQTVDALRLQVGHGRKKGS
jgi:antitoxin YefM